MHPATVFIPSLEVQRVGPLSGQVAVISGGSRGIGSRIAEELARAGANVAIGYRVSHQAAERVVERCRGLGVQVKAYSADVRSRGEVSKWMRQVVDDFGAPSLLIHNAGVESVQLFQDITDAEYHRVMDTHVKGALHLIQGCLRSMLQRRFGRIILLSSIWGEAGGAGEVVYSAAKGAVNGLTRALAKELAPSGITVNAVAPGAIATDMLAAQLTMEEQEDLADQIPMGRLGQPADVAAMVRFLCQEEAGYVTGQVLHVNGGWYP